MTRKSEDLNDRLNSIASSVYEWVERKRQEADRPTDIRLGIWGTARSGKTTYLTMLYQELLSSEFWTVSGTPEAKSFAQGNYSQHIKKGEFGLGTREEKEAPIYEYWLTERENFNVSKVVKRIKNPFGEGEKSILLKFIDAPGKYYEEPSESVGKIKGKEDILEYLNDCDGIIFLLDPARDQDLKPISDLLSDLMSEFQTKYNEKMGNKVAKILPHYMAFCVTKVDEKELLEKADEPELLVKNILGERFFEQLPNYCEPERLKFFAVSSVGYYEEGGKKRGPVEELSKKEEPPKNENEDLPLEKNKPYIWRTDDASDQDKFDFSANQPDESEPESTNKKRIRMDKNPKPLCVIEPVEWLIKGIEKEPPFKNLK